jgi:hypothetical protein
MKAATASGRSLIGIIVRMFSLPNSVDVRMDDGALFYVDAGVIQMTQQSIKDTQRQNTSVAS